jgi:hypothetical protein
LNESDGSRTVSGVSRRSFVSVAFAAALHAAALGALVSRPAKQTPAPERPPETELAIEVAATASPAPNLESEEHAAPGAVAALATAERAKPPEPSQPPSASADVEPEANAGEAHASDGSRGGSDWTFRATSAPIGLGERTGALARASGVEPEIGPSRASPQDRMLNSALDAADAQRGMARGGPLKLAVEEVARTSDAPLEGTALFEIVVGPNHPPRARLVDASADARGWSSLAPAIDRAAAKKELRLPPNGDGLRVRVRVSADVVLPDGRRLKDLGVKTIVQKPDLKDRVAPGESKLVLPAATLVLEGKVCSLSLTAGATLTPIAGGCNIEGIGAQATRRVKTSIVDEERISLSSPP